MPQQKGLGDQIMVRSLLRKNLFHLPPSAGIFDQHPGTSIQHLYSMSNIPIFHSQLVGLRQGFSTCDFPGKL
jgi:hypothetical protein